MALNDVTVHYTLLTKHNPDDPDEVRRYKCSECNDDIFNTNVHAQFAHNTLLFDIDPEESGRENDAPFHPCGVHGCVYGPHEDGPHSWQSAQARHLNTEEVKNA